MSILHKIHKAAGEREILAVADKEAIGKKVKGEKADFVVSERFYAGEEISEEKLKELLHEFEIINLVGEKAVSAAIAEGLASENNVIDIGGVKHLQVMVV